jgi:hypothetical protein
MTETSKPASVSLSVVPWTDEEGYAVVTVIALECDIVLLDNPLNDKIVDETVDSLSVRARLWEEVE